MITGVILAGGQGRRMGGVDKGLRVLQGKPMVAWVLERFAPQVEEILINANQNHEQYARFGHAVVSDEIGGFAGPLAGLERGLARARHELVATVPCDSPFLPEHLVRDLQRALTMRGAQLAVAKTGDQAHPVFCLCRRELHAHLVDFLRSGGRKIDTWYAGLKIVEVPFDDEADSFSNINTEEELHRFETGSRS